MLIIVRLTITIMLLSLSLGVSAAQENDACLAEPEIMTTADGVEFVRTPDACFENLPDWPYEAQYVEIDGLRQAYVDVGTGESGETILLLHGQPSWSYLYRHMIPVLADAGHRVIAMDHVGFGHSDKPIDPDYYTYVGHVERLETFIQELELEQGNLTIFVQDWGSLIGLQVVGTNPEWFDRLVVGNGFLPTFPEGTVPFELPANPELTRNLFHQAITNIPAQQEPLEREPLDIESMAEFDTAGNYFGVWIDYARNDERFRPEVIVESQTYFDLTPAEEAAYAAPFPSRVYMGGARAFPGLVNELPGVTDSGWAGLGEFDKPFLTIWGDNDGGNLGDPAVQQLLIEHIPGSEGWDHVRLEEASHFLQDDAGEEIATRMNAFIAQSPIETDDSTMSIDTLDRGARWLMTGIEELDALEEQTTSVFQQLIGTADERVIVTSELTNFPPGLRTPLNTLDAQNEQVVFRDAATGRELARTEDLPRMTQGSNISPGFGGRVYYVGVDGVLYEITVESN